MSNENQNSNEDIAKEVYAAINRNDIPGVIKLFDPQIERIEPGGIPYHGHEAVLVQFSQARDTWAEGRCEPEQFITLGNKVVVYVHVRVRLKNKTEWIDGRIADGFIFKNSKVIQMLTFIERERALEWIGIKTDE